MHIVADRDKLLARVRRIAGQVAAVERQLTGDAGCSETLQLVASVRGAVGSLMEELIEQHMREHVACPGLSDEARAAAAEEMLALIRRYGK
ncbi:MULTISPECIES: metal/formaldehyde-sensitive transcriptional repressor [Sphingobium]|jgi:DNA-binding FrmR family transcriptional regulator|uniref:DNA-binding FrmR family transcriptional regulator n=1 Tax=Sphingobium xenophagum TaxID=121428 RepID=A0ABU1WVD4_SPHXE|nr:metal/formaldehyde-sensitive transcriptional repressor [Sphingobium xenophagum]MDE0948260.1 metal/formaldehyde-sensitive transcriptional repressor [Sphingobium sp.]MDR7153263.1 DNA-binding FrmR family transcriptional regulator [Sphingobium xenophagum]|tara:strand:+ start:4517 stop:4789 length:273 start_codon:yes stop_codon:yes gene_type:complete